MGICGKIVIIDLHNLQMLFMLLIKYIFFECLSPLHKHEGLQWKTFWRRFRPCPQIWGTFVTVTPKYFFCPPNFVVIRNIYFKHMEKTKIFPP